MSNTEGQRTERFSENSSRNRENWDGDNETKKISASLVVTRQNRGSPLEERCEDLKLLRCLIRPSLRHEKRRSFLFSRLDLLNRTDPGEAVRNVEYMLYSAFLPSSCDLGLPK